MVCFPQSQGSTFLAALFWVSSFGGSWIYEAGRPSGFWEAFFFSPALQVIGFQKFPFEKTILVLAIAGVVKNFACVIWRQKCPSQLQDMLINVCCAEASLETGSPLIPGFVSSCLFASIICSGIGDYAGEYFVEGPLLLEGRRRLKWPAGVGYRVTDPEQMRSPLITWCLCLPICEMGIVTLARPISLKVADEIVYSFYQVIAPLG